MLHILQGEPNGSAIVYTRTRQQTVDIARFLEENGITASNYHAGLTDAEKDYRQINWTKNRVRVMVATNAFGMGIDKPDVRIVLHFNMPDSLEAYFQEAGRAGRDGKTSYAVLLYNHQDLKTLNRRVPETYPDITETHRMIVLVRDAPFGIADVVVEHHAVPFAVGYYLIIIIRESLVFRH